MYTLPHDAIEVGMYQLAIIQPDKRNSHSIVQFDVMGYPYVIGAYMPGILDHTLKAELLQCLPIEVPSGMASQLSEAAKKSSLQVDILLNIIIQWLSDILTRYVVHNPL